MDNPWHVGGPANAELQIDQVSFTGAAEATATVRCLLGPVRLGARSHRIHGATETIDLELAQIVRYGSPAEELDPVHTALVTLRGAGMPHLMAGNPASEWQIVQDTNPPP